MLRLYNALLSLLSRLAAPECAEQAFAGDWADLPPHHPLVDAPPCGC